MGGGLELVNYFFQRVQIYKIRIFFVLGEGVLEEVNYFLQRIQI